MWAMKVCPALLTAYLVLLHTTDAENGQVHFGDYVLTYHKNIGDSKDYFRLDCYVEEDHGEPLLAVITVEGPNYPIPKHVGTLNDLQDFNVKQCNQIFDILSVENAANGQTIDSYKLYFVARESRYKKEYRTIEFLNGQVVVRPLTEGTIPSAGPWTLVPALKLYVFEDNADILTIKDLLNYLSRRGIIHKLVVITPGSTEWNDLKTSTDFVHLPMLEVVMEEKYIVGIRSIIRYIALESKMGASDMEGEHYIEFVSDQIDQLRKELNHILTIVDASNRLEKANEFATILHPILTAWETEVSNNRFLANGKFSWIDVDFRTLLQTLKQVYGDNVMNAHPKLKLLVEVSVTNALAGRDQ